MDITSRFDRNGFEVWTDHLQYLDLGERHQSIPSGKSYIRGTFDPEKDAYVIDKVHIDPDMIRTDVEKELMRAVKLQANKRDKKLLRKQRIAAMPKHEPRMKLERPQPSKNDPMITTDLQDTVWQIASLLAQSLRDPQGPTPGDARWTVSGLSHSSWNINHPDIMVNGESPLTLRIKKWPDGRWVAYGQNRLMNLSNIEILAIKNTPPGGDDWEEGYIKSFAGEAADYFQKQKTDIMELKQSMTPQSEPGAGYGGGQQQQQGEPGGGVGGMGGMMASRRARSRKAADVMTPAQAMIALQIQGTGSLEQDRANLREIAKKNHPDVANNRPGSNADLAKYRYTAATVLLKEFIQNHKPLPRTVQEAQQSEGQGAAVGGPETMSQVNQKVTDYVSRAVSGAGRLQQGLSTPGSQVSPRAAVMSINQLNNYVHGAAVTLQANLGARNPQAQGLYQRLARASRFLQQAAAVLMQAGPRVNQQILDDVIGNLNGFIQAGNEALNSTTTKQARRRASATLDNLKKARRIAYQIHRVCEDQPWFLGVRVVNDKDGVALGVGASAVPSRRLRGSLRGIPVVLEGPGSRMVREKEEGNRRLRLASQMVEGSGETDVRGIRDQLFDKLSREEDSLLRQIDSFPQGVPREQIKDQELLRSLIKKGYLEYVPQNKVRTLGIAASRVAYRISTYGHWQLAVRSATVRLASRVAEEMGVGEGHMEPGIKEEVKRHQRMVKRVYNHIKNSKRLSGSVHYLARKLGINFSDLVSVIGQLIVEGKIELTRKKKFKPLPEPYKPIPGMESRSSATNSVFGIDRGRSDKRVDQLLSQSVFQLNLDEHTDNSDAVVERRDIRERPSKIMPDPSQPN